MKKRRKEERKRRIKTMVTVIVKQFNWTD